MHSFIALVHLARKSTSIDCFDKAIEMNLMVNAILYFDVCFCIWFFHVIEPLFHILV